LTPHDVRRTFVSTIPAFSGVPVGTPTFAAQPVTVPDREPTPFSPVVYPIPGGVMASSRLRTALALSVTLALLLGVPFDTSARGTAVPAPTRSVPPPHRATSAGPSVIVTATSSASFALSTVAAGSNGTRPRPPSSSGPIRSSQDATSARWTTSMRRSQAPTKETTSKAKVGQRVGHA
jgi:hypothetical protein